MDGGRGPGSDTPRPQRAQRCPDCGSTDIDHDPARGDAACVDCGTVLEENTIVAEVGFQEDAKGRASIVGQHLRADGKPSAVLTGMPGFTREATEITMAHGRRKVMHMVSGLRMSNHHADAAMRLFRLAVERNFHKGRRMGNVCCACLYVVCRLEKTPHMLIDFSDILETNLFSLGNTFLKFSRLLNIDVPVIDPSLYISRFAAKLEFGEATHAVAMTALRIVARMKRDWISQGRRPSGLCGAALIVSARMHNFYRSQVDVVRVVRVGVTAVRDRLMEFDKTTARNLTVEELEDGGGDDGKINSLNDNKDFDAADPPAFTRAEKKRTQENIKEVDQVTLENEVRSVLQDPELDQLLEHERSFVEKADETPQITGKKRALERGPIGSVPDKETLSDIDDDEVDVYLNNSAEVEAKQGVWERLNHDYIVEQEQLELLKVENPDQYKRLKPWRFRKAKPPSDAEKDAGGNSEKSPKERKQSSKVNYAVLDDLFATDNP